MREFSIENDLYDVKRLFNVTDEARVCCRLEGNRLFTEIRYLDKSYSFSDSIEAKDEVEFKRLYRRAAKKRLYDVLKENTGKFLPWGSLTGIRPVRLFSQTAREMGYEEAARFFIEYYDVSPQKLDLVRQIEKTQRKYLESVPDYSDLYLGIPFCRGRCSYCSFVSAEIEKSSHLVKDYAASLIKETEFVKDLIEKSGISINSIYIGGGTPSSLPVEELKNILAPLKNIGAREFTFEAGRPDSIDKELLDMLKSYSASRISINPQTANDETLKRIGRRHTFSDCQRAYELAKGYGFIINMDIIAGLPGEDPEDFKRTADAVIALRPHNVTVHTLCLKRGALLAREEYTHAENASRMLDYAQSALHNSGYNAYYMYRQKNTAGNLENVGYSLDGFECLYNMDNMEDTVSVIACGANAISKRVYAGGRIERLDSPKDIKTYLDKTEKILRDKLSFFG